LSREMVDLFFQMVGIDSESGEEEQFLEFLGNLFSSRLGGECVRDNYGNLIIRLAAKDSLRHEPILVGVHADTVKPGKGIVAYEEQGIIRSKGETVLGADDKAGIAELIEAIRTSSKHPPLEIVVTRQEEPGTLGSKNLDVSLLESKKGFVIDMDALDAVVVGGPSYMKMKAEFTGKSAHAGMEPEKGISAIRAAACAISIMREGWIDHETTVNVGVINGGMVTNAVPEKAVIELECRSLSHEKCIRQVEVIGEVLQAAAKSLGASVGVQRNLLIKAIRIPDSAETVQAAKEAIEAVGLAPNVQVICGGTDASNYNAKGIETVVIGTGVKAEHTKDECIAVADMEKAVGIIRHLFHIFSA
jgi:tripeptide aminopeptidase